MFAGPAVVVVDECPDTAQLLQGVLEGLLGPDHYEIVQCADGQRAVHVLRHHQPDLLVLNTQLRNASPWHIITAWRTMEATAETAVLVYSAAVRELQQMTSWLRNRRGDVVALPLDIEDFERKVQRLLTWRALVRPAS
jgi:CheY-like chemotaxis protein